MVLFRKKDLIQRTVAIDKETDRKLTYIARFYRRSKSDIVREIMQNRVNRIVSVISKEGENKNDKQ